MYKRSANYFLFLLLFCASILSFSQDDESMILLKDADDKQIKFENHYFEALKYKAIENYARAITELEKCQQLFSDDTAIAFELSKNYLFLKKFDEASLYIENALKKAPENYWFLEHAKKVYLRQYNYPKAIENQEKIIKQNPKKIEDLVLVYLQARKYKKAQKLVDKLDSSQYIYSKLERYKKILSNYNQKRTVIPTQKVVIVSKKTLEELKEQFENDKQYAILEEILKQELATKKFENLLVYSNKGLELFPAQPYIYLMNGKALLNIQKYKEAIDVLNNGIDFVVDAVKLEADFYTQLAICYDATKQQIKAKKQREKARKLVEKRNAK